MGGEGRLLLPDARASAARTSGRSASTSATSRSKATTPARRSAAGRSRGRAVRRERSHDLADAVHEHRCRPTRTSRSRPTPRTCRTTGRSRSGLTFNLGLRYDLQTGSFNEDVPDLLGKIEDKLGRDGSFPFDVSIFPQPRPNRGDKQQLRSARRHGLGPGEQRRHQRPRGVRVVLRQHADAAELRRADLAAGQADHDPATRAIPIRSAAGRANRSWARRRRR